MITLRDKLSHLTYRQACRHLGEEGEGLIRQGGRFEIEVAEPSGKNPGWNCRSATLKIHSELNRFPNIPGP
jgi:hypothetical protein